MSNASMTMISTPRFFGFTTLLLASMFLLTSCQAEIKSVEPTLNPNPKEIYEITVTVENAPGEFTSGKGNVLVSLKSWKCLPPPSALSMSGSPPVKIKGTERPFSFKRVSPNIFVAKVVLDPYLPINNRDRGICPWNIGSLSLALNNNINVHSISISPTKQVTKRRAYRLDLFTLAHDPLSKVSPPPGGWPSDKLPRTISGWDIEYNQKQYNQVFSNDEYFFISIATKRINQ